MHLNTQQASVLAHRLHETIQKRRDVEVVIAPSMLTLQPLSHEIDRRRFRLCAQNAHPQDEGAFTGEVSFAMLGELAHYCLVGHSARRLYFGETDDFIRDKVAAAVRNEIVPIICVGETRIEREAGESRKVLSNQITTALMNVTSSDLENVVIAYEPVWAISTFDGILAKPEDVEEAITFIRKQIASLYGARSAAKVRILYGGSVNEHDAANYLRVDGVDGVLVGAASINYKQFSKIAEVAYGISIEKASKK